MAHRRVCVIMNVRWRRRRRGQKVFSKSLTRCGKRGGRTHTNARKYADTQNTHIRRHADARVRKCMDTRTHTPTRIYRHTHTLLGRHQDANTRAHVATSLQTHTNVYGYIHIRIYNFTDAKAQTLTNIEYMCWNKRTLTRGRWCIYIGRHRGRIEVHQTAKFHPARRRGRHQFPCVFGTADLHSPGQIIHL